MTEAPRNGGDGSAPSQQSADIEQTITVWKIRSEHNTGKFVPVFNQTKTVLTEEGAVINKLVGIRLDSEGLDIVEILEKIEGEWSVVQRLPFEIRKDYIITRNVVDPTMPSEIRFGSHRKTHRNGKKNLRFYVGDHEQRVSLAGRIGVEFPRSASKPPAW